jgi:hypothetical protein
MGCEPYRSDRLSLVMLNRRHFESLTIFGLTLL